MTADPMTLPGDLVSTDWLAEHLGRPRLVVLDGTFHMPAAGRDPRAEFAAAHIPGAQFFDIDGIAEPSNPLPHMLPDDETFAAAVSALGVANDTAVVIYDTHGLMSAARPWWSLRVFGHDQVAVLDGGLPKWRAEGRPISDALEAPAPTRFTARYRPNLVRDWRAVRDTIDSGAEFLVDARAAPRFEGTVDDPWPGRRRGHVPGSGNLPFTDLVDPTTGTLLPAEALARRLAAAGVSEDRPAVASCGSGVTAGVIALAARVAGLPDMAIYDGSWSEWGLREDLPVALGPPGKP